MRRFRLWSAVLPALVGLLGACRTEKQPPPIGNKLSAPTGLLVLGNSTTPVLLVSNANFRLEYDSGSVVSIDTSLVDENKRFNLIDDVALSDVPLPNFSGPIALAPDGKTALVTNRFTQGDVGTAPDRVFFIDVSNPASLALAQFPAGHVGTNGEVVVGEDPYGVITLRLPPQGPGRPPRDVAFVANETDGTISVLNLTPGTTCDDLAPAPCEQDAVPPAYASRAVFADVGTASTLRFTGPGVTPLVTLNQHWTATFVEGLGLCLAPADGSANGYWRVVGSASGQLLHHACTDSLFVDAQVSFEIDRVTDTAGNLVGRGPSAGDSYEFDTFYGDFDPVSRIPLSRAMSSGVISGVGVSQLLYDPFRDRIYATSRRTNLVYAIDATNYAFLGAFQIVSNVSGIDARGMALSPDGSELYVVDRSPESVMVIDPDALEADPANPKLNTQGVIASIPVSPGPSEIAVSPDGHYAFVTAFNANAVDILDLQTRQQVRSIPTGQSPYTLRLRADGKRAYVATFFGPGIDVLDIDDSSPTFGTVLTTIGDSDYSPDF